MKAFVRLVGEPGPGSLPVSQLRKHWSLFEWNIFILANCICLYFSIPNLIYTVSTISIVRARAARQIKNKMQCNCTSNLIQSIRCEMLSICHIKLANPPILFSYFLQIFREIKMLDKMVTGFVRLFNPFIPGISSKMSHSTNRGRWYQQPIDELSRHRSNPPTFGISRRTRLICVDNSEIGKEANMSGKLAYCIWVYKHGYKKRHMPKAVIGDKVLVAVRGEMKKAVVVGAKQHVFVRRHGIPSTDTNNIVLLDEDGNPLGNRVLAPLPSYLMRLREKPHVAKVTALAKKYF